jgi:tetratricopeptide (TPR) repeat protein
MADVHRFRNDFESEIKVYLRWITENPDAPDLPYLRLADAYVQSSQHRRGIETYQEIIHDPRRARGEIEWAQLRQAIAYEQLGDFNQGDKLYNMLLQTAKNPLIRKMADEHLHMIPSTQKKSLPATLPLEQGAI